MYKIKLASILMTFAIFNVNALSTFSSYSSESTKYSSDYQCSPKTNQYRLMQESVDMERKRQVNDSINEARGMYNKYSQKYDR